MTDKRDLNEVIDTLEWCVMRCKNAIANDLDVLSKRALDSGLEDALNQPVPPGQTILMELVTHEIKAALKGDDRDTKQNALQAYREMSEGRGIDDEIPF